MGDWHVETGATYTSDCPVFLDGKVVGTVAANVATELADRLRWSVHSLDAAVAAARRELPEGFEVLIRTTKGAVEVVLSSPEDFDELLILANSHPVAQRVTAALRMALGSPRP